MKPIVETKIKSGEYIVWVQFNADFDYKKMILGEVKSKRDARVLIKNYSGIGIQNFSIMNKKKNINYDDV